jgi:hypothetical protein
MAIGQMSERADEIHTSNSIDGAERPHELWTLVRKLRWIGMEEEARRLQLRMRSMSTEHGTALCETFNTD